MSKPIADYAKEWQDNAEADPLWVILTDSKYYGGKWDVAEFFATGEEEIGRVFKFMEQESIHVPAGTFLDFGCGVGRLSKVLKKRFDQGFGVDISRKMTELAHGYVPDVEFVANESDSLSFLADCSVNFVYTHIVLQHIPNAFQKRYIDEFLRILRPGGLAVFQIPLEIINPREIHPPLMVKVKKIIKRLLPFLVTLKRGLTPPTTPHHEFRYEIHPLPDSVIREICNHHGCSVEAAPATNSCDADHNGKVEFYDAAAHKRSLEARDEPNLYYSCMYFVRKPV